MTGNRSGSGFRLPRRLKENTVAAGLKLRPNVRMLSLTPFFPAYTNFKKTRKVANTSFRTLKSVLPVDISTFGHFISKSSALNRIVPVTFTVRRVSLRMLHTTSVWCLFCFTAVKTMPQRFAATFLGFFQWILTHLFAVVLHIWNVKLTPASQFK